MTINVTDFTVENEKNIKDGKKESNKAQFPLIIVTSDQQNEHG